MNPIYKINPKLVPYVITLTSHEFGVQGAHAEIRNVECGSIVGKRGKDWGDRFNLIITYCGKMLNWQVLMCPNNLMEPPDFIMDDDFISQFDVDLIESQVPSLAHWQPSDPRCLLNVVLELLQLYKNFQVELLTRNRGSNLSMEYDALLNVVSQSDLELYVHNDGRVSLLTCLKIDFSKLPLPVPNNKSLILLLLEVGENVRPVVSLIKGDELDEVFGSIDLPNLSSDMMLSDYIPLVEHELQSEVNEIVSRLNKRKMLYSYLCHIFSPAILNGDTITFHSISFLFEVNESYYVIIVEIPLSFPDTPPIISKSSMKRNKLGKQVTCEQLPFNSQWSIDKISKKVYEFIKKTSALHAKANFQNNETK